jgi:hypothetical protein
VEPALFDELVSLEDEHWWLVGRRRLLVALVEQACTRLNGHVHLSIFAIAERRP